MFKEFIERLSGEDGFRFAEPWKLSDQSLSVAIPIIATRFAERPYLVYEEVRDKIMVSDTGRINMLRVKGIDRATFIRPGTIFEGQGTQSRAVNHGTIIQPEKEAEIEVRCVHASYPVHQGRQLKYAFDAPIPVVRVLVADAGQHSTWSAVSNWISNWTAKTRVSFTAPTVTPDGQTYTITFTDDLASYSKSLEQFNNKVKAVIQHFPILKDQVGVAIINIEGVQGIEVFDHPDSWRAAASSVAKKYSDILVEEDKAGLYSIDVSKAKTVLAKWLEGLREAEETVVQRGDAWKTVRIETEKALGEYTAINERIIYMLALKRDESPQGVVQLNLHRKRRSKWWDVSFHYDVNYPCSTDARYTHVDTNKWTSQHTPLEIKLLGTLAESKTWTETWRAVQPLGHSTKTLDKTLKKFMRQGLVDKKVRENGKRAYFLTNLGRKYLERLTKSG